MSNVEVVAEGAVPQCKNEGKCQSISEGFMVLKTHLTPEIHI